MFETFTVHAREAIERAQREAADLGHDAVGVEHLLLALLGCEDDIVSQVWTDFGLTVQPVREMVLARLTVNLKRPPEGVRPFSQAAKETLRSAYRLGMGNPGPEHVLIALTRRAEGAASEALLALGVDPNQVRAGAKRRTFTHVEPVPSLQRIGHSPLLRELDFGDL